MKKTEEEEEAAAETSQWISKYLTHTHRMMWANERALTFLLQLSGIK